MARRRRERGVSRSFDPLGALLMPRSIAAPVLPRLVAPVVARIEDRRLFHPEGAFKAPSSLFRMDRRIVARSNKAQSYPSVSPRYDTNLSFRVGFAVPNRVAICAKRKIRREVINAKGIAGGSVSRRRRRNYWSDVDC